MNTQQSEMEIRIANYVTASSMMEREPKAWNVIALLDSGTTATDFLTTHSQSSLCLWFDDIESTRANRLLPSREQVERALDFASDKPRLLVSCRAGQGRSAALAYVVGCQNLKVEQALKLLNPKRHLPNRRIVALGDGLLATSEALVKFDVWKLQHAHVRLSDYYDEMERELDGLEAQGATNRICTS